MVYMAREKPNTGKPDSQAGIKERKMPKREEIIDFTSFNEKTDMAGLMQDLANAESGNSGDFPDIPHGKYEVSIDTLQLTVSKKGSLMMKCQMRIKGGQYNKCCLFYNQAVANGKGLHDALEFLRDLDVVERDDVKFAGDFNKLRDLINTIRDEIEKTNLTYGIEYGENDKGFDTYKITDVFEN